MSHRKDKKKLSSFQRWTLYGAGSTGIIILLLSMVLSVSLLSGTGSFTGLALPLLPWVNNTPTSTTIPLPQPPYTQASHLVRIHQLPEPETDANCAASGYTDTGQCKAWGDSACGPTSITILLKAWHDAYPNNPAFDKAGTAKLGNIILFMVNNGYADAFHGMYLPPLGQVKAFEAYGLGSRYFWGSANPANALSIEQLHYATSLGMSVLVGLNDKTFVNPGDPGTGPLAKIKHWINLKSIDLEGNATFVDSSNYSSYLDGIQTLSADWFKFYYDGDAVTAFPPGQNPFPGL